MMTLPFVAIYIINQVKLRRLIAGIPAEKLSELIGMSDAYISGIESMATKNQYPLDVLTKIAKVLKCEVRDFYPPDELLLKNDGSNVLKDIISLADIEGASNVINGMIEFGYFKKPKSFANIAKHLQIYGKPEAPIVEQALNNFVANGKLTLTNGSYIQP